MAMESIRLWLALTPKQFDDLNNGKEIQPDEYSKRFGLRKDPIAAVERAQYFNDWTPEGPKGEFCAKDYVLVEVELTAIGYLQKAEAGILLKYKTQRISLARNHEGFGVRREWQPNVQVWIGSHENCLRGL